MSVYPAYQKKEKIDDHHCLDCFDLRFHQSASFTIRRAWMHVLSSKTLILRVVLLNVLTHRFASVLSLALCLYQRTVASNCRVQSQQPVLFWIWRPAHLVVIESTVWILDRWVDLILAMPYTRSLTDNRASLLTILMFSTGFSVCSCTVLYTVANTSVFPFLSGSFRGHESSCRCYMCVSWSCIKATGFSRDSVRKHTVALTKKKQCCTDRYIWWSLCVYSIHL